MDKQTDGQKNDMTQMTLLVTLFTYILIYVIASPTLPSGCYKFREKLNMPCSRHKNNYLI